MKSIKPENFEDLSADDTSISTLSSVQKRVEELRSFRGKYQNYSSISRPSSSTLTKQLILKKKKAIFQFWRHLWYARSFYRFILLKRSFKTLKNNRFNESYQSSKQNRNRNERNRYNDESESDISDEVSELSTTSNSTSISQFNSHFHPAANNKQRNHRNNHNNNTNQQSMKEISHTINQLSSIYKLDEGDTETLTSLSTLNTNDYILMASSSPQHKSIRPPDINDDSDSDTNNLQFVSSSLPSSSLHSSAVSSSYYPNHPSRIGGLLRQHGNILPTQSTPLKIPHSNSNSNSNSISVITPQKYSKSLQLDSYSRGSPVGHRKKINQVTQFHSQRLVRDSPISPPPPPPPPLISHNLQRHAPQSPSVQEMSVDFGVYDSFYYKNLSKKYFTQWTNSHKRRNGIKLMAIDHFLKKGFFSFLQSLQRCVRDSRKILQSDQCHSIICKRRALRRLKEMSLKRKDSCNQNQDQSQSQINSFMKKLKLKHSFWRWINHHDILKTTATIEREGLETASTSYKNKCLSKGFSQWKVWLDQRSVIKNASKTVQIQLNELMRVYFRSWNDILQTKRHYRQKILFPISIRKALKQWKDHYRQVLTQLELCTQMDLRRESNQLRSTLRYLQQRSQRKKYYIMRSVSFYRRRRLSFGLNALCQWTEWKRKNANNRNNNEKKQKSSFLKIKEKNQKRSVDQRNNPILSRNSSPFQSSQSLRPLRSLQRTQQQQQQTNIPSYNSLSRYFQKWFEYSSKKGDRNVRVKIFLRNKFLHSCRIFLSKLHEKCQQKQKQQQQQRYNQKPIKSNPSNPLNQFNRFISHSSHPSQTSNTSKIKPQKPQKDLVKLENTLKEIHDQSCLFQAFLIWYLTFQASQFYRQQRFAQGFQRFLQFCTRVAVSRQLFNLADKFYHLCLKKKGLKQLKKLLNNTKDTNTKQKKLTYLQEKEHNPPSKPPIHPRNISRKYEI